MKERNREDLSWHNDVCPSFSGDGIEIFVDAEKSALREGPDSYHYPLFFLAEEGICGPFLGEFENVEPLILFLKAFTADPIPYPTK